MACSANPNPLRERGIVLGPKVSPSLTLRVAKEQARSRPALTHRVGKELGHGGPTRPV